MGLLIGIVVGYFVYPATNPTQSISTTQLPSIIKIGALLSLSGTIKSYGETQKAALQLAQIDINNWHATVRPGVQLQIIYEDTGTNPDTALSELQTLAAQGVKFIIGPVTSAELKNIMNYAQSNQIIVVSASSTSMELAVNKPFVYRFDPPDVYQDYALSRMIIDANVKYVIIVVRHASWGDSGANGLADRLTKLGVQFEILQYPPETTDFTAIVADLNNRVTAAVQNYGNNQVGVVLFAGDEGAFLIHDSASYNALKHVKWFGSDGTEGSGYFIQDTTVAQFNIQTRMVHAVFNPTFTNITQKVRQYIIS